MFNRCFADRPAPTSIKRVCVFCGARRGRNPLFTQIASELGRELARAGLGIIYGGGGSGLMGTVARAALQSGGAVTGVMPRFLAEREEALLDNHEFILVDDMGARKSEMAARADAFIALPGGLGTLEEIAEQITWAKLGRHTKPMVLLDAANYWRHLTSLLDHMCAEGFTSAEDFERLFIAPDVPTAISRVIGLRPPSRVDIVSDQRCALPLLNEIATGEALHEVYFAPPWRSGAVSRPLRSDEFSSLSHLDLETQSSNVTFQPSVVGSESCSRIIPLICAISAARRTATSARACGSSRHLVKSQASSAVSDKGR